MNKKEIHFKTTNQLDLSSYTSGIYFIHLNSNQESYVHKVIKN
ncbi:T9SS type A sorting domain-containing protein [Xanthomarina spongicola]